MYTGPMVKVLGGADIFWVAGFVVAGVGYLIATRLATSPSEVSPEPAEVAD